MLQEPMLTSEENQHVGALVVAFGCLEHEIIRAAISISGGLQDISAKDEKKIENVLEDGTGLKARLQVFCGLARKHKAMKKNEISDLCDNMEYGISSRNLVCHGLWRRTPEGQLQVTLYDKGCVSRKAPVVGLFSLDDIKGLTKVTLDCAKQFSEL